MGEEKPVQSRSRTNFGHDIDRLIEVEAQKRINKLRRELLADRERTVDWWLVVVTGVLGVISLFAVIGGYLWFTEFKELEEKTKAEVKRLIGEIETSRDKSHQLLDNIETIHAAAVSRGTVEVGRIAKAVHDDPRATLTSRAIAKAAVLQQQERIDDAIKIWRSVAVIAKESNPQLAARALFSVGYLLYDKAPQDSIAAYNEAIELDPNSAIAYGSRGAAKRKLGRYEEAIVDLDKAITLDPTYDIAYVVRGQVKNILGRYEEAIADFEEAIELDPYDGSTYGSRGEVKIRLGRLEEALVDFDEAIKLDPRDAIAHNWRGDVMAQLGRKDEALKNYNRALQLVPVDRDPEFASDLEQKLRKLQGSR